MPTRYVTRSSLRALLRESGDPLAERAGDALDPTDAELVPVSPGGLDRHTYEVRLARAEDGEGPATFGLHAFVEALGRPMSDAESLGFQGNDDSHYIVLLAGGRVVAITATEPG